MHGKGLVSLTFRYADGIGGMVRWVLVLVGVGCG